jgi:chromosomal replication initiation ATPase DnaA
VSEPSENAAESTSLAWDHLYASSSPGLRRWLTTGQPVALHQDMLMVAVPNIFTRNQLENRFRSDIESLLSGYFGRAIQLAVIVDESLKPADEDLVMRCLTRHPSQAGLDSSQTRAITRTSFRRYRKKSRHAAGLRQRRLLGEPGSNSTRW